MCSGFGTALPINYSHIMKSSCIMLLVLCLGVSAYGQTFTPTANLSTTNTGNNTLIHSEITTLAQDGTAILIGTPQGLSRYAGGTFQTLLDRDTAGPGSTHIHGIAPWSEGGWWLTVDQGLHYYDGTTFTYLTQDSLSAQVDSLDYIVALDSGELYMAGRSGRYVHYTQADGWQNPNDLDLSLYGEIMGMDADADENLWFATSASGLVMWDGFSVTTITTSAGMLSDDLADVFVDGTKVYTACNGGFNIFENFMVSTVTNANIQNPKSLFVDADGTVWIGTNDALFSYTTGGTWSSIPLGFEGGGFAFDYDFRPILPRNGGGFWIGTQWGLLEVTDLATPAYTVHQTYDGLLANTAEKLLVDVEGDLWVATSRSGMSEYNGTTWSWLYDQIPAPGGTWLQTTTAQFIASDGSIWLGGNGGVMHSTDGANWTAYASTNEANGVVQSQVIQAITEDANGNIWIGGTDVNNSPALSIFDGANWNYLSTASGLPSGQIERLIADSQGNVWATFANSQTVSRIAGGTTVTNFTASNGTPSLATVTDIATAPNGAFWVATDDGLGMYNGTWTHYQASSSGGPLLSANVSALTIDSDGYVWVAYADYNGLSVFGNGQWFYLGPNNGVPTGRITTMVTQANAGNNSNNLWLAYAGQGLVSANASILAGELVNQAPQVVGTMTNQTYLEGFASDTLSLAGIFSDPEGQALTYSVENPGDSVVTLVVNGASLLVTEVGFGITEITLMATDIYGLSAETTFTIVVEEDYTGGGGDGGGTDGGGTDGGGTDGGGTDGGGTPTGIQDEDESSERFSYYPNPASEYLTLKDKSPSSHSGTIQIVAADGREVYRQEVSYPANQISIPIYQLQPGSYVGRIIGGDEPYTFRFIKQ